MLIFETCRVLLAGYMWLFGEKLPGLTVQLNNKLKNALLYMILPCLWTTREVV